MLRKRSYCGSVQDNNSTSFQLPSCPCCLRESQVSTTVSNLGVVIDGQLNMVNHVASLCRSCFFQLRQRRLVRSSLTSEATKTLVHAFVSSRLDYCNYLLYGVSDGLLEKLQAVQNSAARVVTGTRKFDHITLVLRDLNWLPIRQRILFKLAMIVFKCLHGHALSYLADDCVLAPVDDICGLPTPWNCWYGDPGLSSAPETLQFRPQPFGTICQQLWDCLPDAQFRQLRRNWKLSTPARRCSASEDHLFCALQMHSLLLLLPARLCIEAQQVMCMCVCICVCVTIYPQNSSWQLRRMPTKLGKHEQGLSL